MRACLWFLQVMNILMPLAMAASMSFFGMYMGWLIFLLIVAP